MAKQINNKAKRTTGDNLGKGKVTPVQVAFIVDRYLADNNYQNALAAFRSDASSLFSKTKGKEVPKGLLGLGEILDEYIRLKEQKIVLDQEKRRVEMAMNGLQEVMRAYQSGTGTPLPSSPPLVPPQFVGNSINLTNNGSPPSSVMNYQAVTTNSAIQNLSTPVANELISTNCNNNNNKNKKRKGVNFVPKAPPAPKKFCSQNPALNPCSSKPVPTTGTSQEKPNNSVAKTLFKSDQSISKSPPETPQNPKQTEFQIPNPNSQCSVISQERILVSPNKAYYSVERSYQITSPYKPSAKGKLDFDSTDLNVGNGIPVLKETGNSNPGSAELANGLDFDFSDFDLLNGDFSFSELLIDLDLGCENTNNNQAENIASLDRELNGEARKLSVEDYSNDENIQVPGPESVTSIRAITKRIKIMSPVKARRVS